MAEYTLNYENWKILNVCVTETIATKSGKEERQKGTKSQEKLETNIILIGTLNIPFQEIIDKEYIWKYYMIE